MTVLWNVNCCDVTPNCVPGHSWSLETFVTIRTRTALTGALVVGAVAGIYRLQRQRNGRGSGASSRVMTIGKPLHEVERAWHDPRVREMVFAAVPHLADKV